LLKEPGKCDKKLERFYFDQKLKACLFFIYSGCEGNANNFETLEECKTACMKDDNIDEPQGAIDGPNNEPDDQRHIPILQSHKN
jgi:hypothetical protein